jgi:carbon storage regulator
MLVLTRKAGQKIRIGNHIIVTVFHGTAGQVKLGIDAPDDIPIYREEVYERIREKNRSSVVTPALSPGILSRLARKIQ